MREPRYGTVTGKLSESLIQIVSCIMNESKELRVSRIRNESWAKIVSLLASESKGVRVSHISNEPRSKKVT